MIELIKRYMLIKVNKRVIDNLYSDINNDGMLLINSIYAREDYNKNFRNKINSIIRNEFAGGKNE